MPFLVPIEPPWDQRLANRLIRPFLSSALTPNHITSVGLLVGLAAIGCYALGGSYMALGAILFAAAYVIDHADGEFARLTGKTSALGHYYDLAVDGLVLTGVFLGMGIGLRDQVFGISTTWLGLVAGIGIAIIFLLRGELERRYSKAATRQPNLWGFEVQDLLYLILPITWLGWLKPFLALAAIGAPLYALFVCWEGWSWYRHASAERT
ncbi:MAG: CDP-alcohol phosphatidyltransferase family protein [Alphaproteobacteria bacterium]